MTQTLELSAELFADPLETSPFAEQFRGALEWLCEMRAYVNHGEHGTEPLSRLDEMTAALMDIGCELVIRGFYMPDIPDWLIDPMGALHGWSEWLEKTGPHVAINDQLARDHAISKFASMN